jgi:hypothetical protein
VKEDFKAISSINCDAEAIFPPAERHNPGRVLKDRAITTGENRSKECCSFSTASWAMRGGWESPLTVERANGKIGGCET